MILILCKMAIFVLIAFSAVTLYVKNPSPSLCTDKELFAGKEKD